jgi:trimethylamine--corrinoid protein Co-methyltransferase
MRDFQVRKAPLLEFLSQDELREIHRGTLEVLERTGVKVYDDEAVSLLKNAGAIVEGDLVRIPSYLVEEAIRTAPKRITMCTRDGERFMFLEGGKVYYGTGSDTPYILDSYTGEYRLTVKDDVEKVSTIIDCLPNIDFVMSMGLVKDAPTEVSDIHQFEAMALNSRKPVIFTSHNAATLRYIIEEAEVIAGGAEALRKNPFVALYTEPSSPLMHSKEAIEKVLICAEKFIPDVYTIGMMSGATAPMSSAGLLVQANCELLSGLTIGQLKQKGAPMIYGGMVTIMDMTTSIFSYGAPELYLRQACEAQMAKFYGLPMFGVGGCTDACTFDQQAGLEQGFSLLMATLSGVNLIHDVGYLAMGMVASWENLVMSNESIGWCKRLLQGVPVASDSLALDVINEVGPGGHYLMTDYTMRRFKDELWVPKLANRKGFEVWKAAGATEMGTRVNEEVKRILKEYRAPELPADIVAKVKGLTRDAETKLVKKGKK